MGGGMIFRRVLAAALAGVLWTSSGMATTAQTLPGGQPLDNLSNQLRYGPFTPVVDTSGGATGGQARQAENLAPFQLSPREQQFVDEVLAAWEKHSGKIKTFECQFTKWTYTPQLGPFNDKQQLQASMIAKGELKYLQPDRGLYVEKDIYFWNAQGKKYEKASGDYSEHWVCDGRTVWKLNAKQKQVEEYPLPADMQGKTIADGPLPFMLFGSESAKLKSRYFLRERTDPKYAQQEIWLEAYPRWRNDAANFRNSQLIMDRARFLPNALRLYSPNGQDYQVFEFASVVLNNPFFKESAVSQPAVPRGWQMVREPAAPAGPVAPAGRTSPPANNRAGNIQPVERQSRQPSGTGTR